MSRLIEVVLMVMCIPAMAASALIWYYIRKLRRPIMFSSQSQFKPPLRWRWSLSQAAIFHRRLVLALRACRATAESSSLYSPTSSEAGLRRIPSLTKKRESSWESILSELELVAIEIDRRLLSFEREPREVRRRMIEGFERDVSQVELASAKAVGMFQSWQRTLPSGSADKVIDRIDALDSALSEIQHLDEISIESEFGFKALDENIE